MRTIEQARAADALARVKEVEDQSFSGRYRSYVDRLGSTIVMNGLGQALATELAATGIKEAHRKLYDCMTCWLSRKDGGVYPGEPDLLQAIVSNDEECYLRAQVEALAWLEWHKKFCRAYLPDNDGGGE